MADHASKSMTSFVIDSVASYGWNCTIIGDAVDQSEAVDEELLRGLENDKCQSCTQLTRVRLADTVGLSVSDERVEDDEWDG